jgi:hypothetical protein
MINHRTPYTYVAMSQLLGAVAPLLHLCFADRCAILITAAILRSEIKRLLYYTVSRVNRNCVCVCVFVCIGVAPASVCVCLRTRAIVMHTYIYRRRRRGQAPNIYINI